MSATTYPIPHSRPLVGQILLSLVFGLLLFVILLISSIVGYQLRYAGKIFPGVKVAGIDVSGLKPSEASALSQSQFIYPKAGRLLLQDQDKAWLAAPVDLGLYLDPETTASAAYEIGRSGTIGDRLSAQFQAWREGIEIAPVLVFDQRTAFSYLTALAYQVDQPVVEASLSLNGTEVDVRPGQPGRQLDLPASLALITAQVQTLRDGSVPLVVNPTQPAILDASEQADLARRILSEPLTLTLPEGQPGIDGSPWVFDQATLAAMLNIEKVVTPEGKPTFQVTLNSDTLRQFMYDLAPKLALGPQNARFIFNDDTHQLEVIQTRGHWPRIECGKHHPGRAGETLLRGAQHPTGLRYQRAAVPWIAPPVPTWASPSWFTPRPPGTTALVRTASRTSRQPPPGSTACSSRPTPPSRWPRRWETSAWIMAMPRR